MAEVSDRGLTERGPSGEPLRVDILGVGISAVNPDQALESLTRWIERGERQYVCVTGVHGVMEAQRDPILRRIHNASGLTVPDGVPTVWAGKRAGATWMSRVYGPDLMRAACAFGAERGWRMFFYGATEDVVAKLVRHLEQAYPGLRVVGCISPPFRPLNADESQEMANRINGAAPDIVWIGLSTPKQERWMAEHRDLLDASVLIGVGAAFDLVSGEKRQAPAVLQRVGLEWAFRMATEPRRLWRRYARNNPAFLLAIARHPPRLTASLGHHGESASR